MASSVKVSKLIENYDLKLCNPGIDTDKIKITVPDINRPSLEWTGYFEHFAEERIQIIGMVECRLSDLPRIPMWSRWIKNPNLRSMRS